MLVVIILFLLYVYYYNQATAINNISSTNQTDDADLENFTSQAAKDSKKVRFCKNLDVRDPDTTTYYGSRIDTITDKDIDKAMTSLLDDKVVEIKEPANCSEDEKYIPIGQTDQSKMFDELENEIKKQYDEIYQKDGYFKSVERPNMPTALANDEKTNSELNPIINPHAFEPTSADIDGDKTIWELYDEMTTNNFKKYSNLDQLKEKENSGLYNIGQPDNYGGTKFDTYGL